MIGPKITRKRAVAAGVLAAGAVAVGVVVLGGGASDGASTAVAASTSTATTAIKRQDLVEVDTEDGTLGYADTRSVVNHLSGTVTWLASVGSTVHSDHALYKVDGSPVILMNGRLPAYRTLRAGITTGVDIRQLERTLRAQGYDAAHAMTVDSSWSAATTAAVKRWQLAHGLSQTGSITLGRIVFLPGTRRISSTSATLGGSASAAGGSGSGGATTTGASAIVGDAPATQAVAMSGGDGSSLRLLNAAYRTTAPTAQTTTPSTTTTPSATTTTPAPTTTTPAPTTTAPATTTPAPTTTAPSKTAKTPAARATPSAGATSPSTAAAKPAQAAPSAAGSSTANTLMTTTSSRRVVTVALPTTKSALAKLGQRVTVKLPSGSDVHGPISSVGKVATSASTTSGTTSSTPTEATIKVTIRLLESRGSLDQAPVTVRFEQSRRKNVLAIPVTALLARPGGTFAVQVVEAGGTRRTVPVQTGLYTSGYVEIDGAGLRPGMHVTNAAIE
ncbi:MAG: hypothetical protein QOE31_3182 [Solirubrobacteraceae bacterium]|jgi:hypothetical protein|nr:hypothetical protein [Solirubrobacteraceae bacterium]